MFTTSHRGVIERSFSKDWATRILGGRSQIPAQYLESYGKPPTPNVPKIYTFIMVDMAIKVC